MTVTLHSIAEAVEQAITLAGRHVRLAMPLGIGKPNAFANQIYQRAAQDRRLQLDIYTALSLLKPHGSSELEQRFLGPLAERLYGDYPDLDYALAMQDNALPANVRVFEFFLKSGDWLANAHAQQHYISSNYTHIARDMANREPNVLAQAIAIREQDGVRRYSLACNPDVTLDLACSLRQQREAGAKNLFVGVINRALPFIPGTAEVPAEFFDILVDDPAGSHTLFCTPNMKVGLADYAIGLHASSLVHDGGTLQIGIGSLGDAIAQCLLWRERDNSNYRQALRALNHQQWPSHIQASPFSEGLYGCSEMLVNGLLQLLQAGILRRTVTDAASGRAVALHGGFFLGPRSFYQALRDMSETLLSQIDMTSITFINQLYSDARASESLKRTQRVKASFINTCMMMTLSGAAVSDGLADGRVVSGVGGQYNFVAMAHELPDARSILMLRSWRMQDGEPSSNIVTEYGHCTIPRHLRDIVVTEYGVADLRGKSDSEIIIALLSITDARFQSGLCDWAKSHGKLPADFSLPSHWQLNTPEQLRKNLQAFRAQLPDFPFGHDFTEDELVIINALQSLKAASSDPMAMARLLVNALLSEQEAPERYLERLGLQAASSLKEKLLRRLFAGNL